MDRAKTKSLIHFKSLREIHHRVTTSFFSSSKHHEKLCCDHFSTECLLTILMENNFSSNCLLYVVWLRTTTRREHQEREKHNFKWECLQQCCPMCTYKAATTKAACAKIHHEATRIGVWRLWEYFSIWVLNFISKWPIQSEVLVRVDSSWSGQLHGSFCLFFFKFSSLVGWYKADKFYEIESIFEEFFNCCCKHEEEKTLSVYN